MEKMKKNIFLICPVRIANKKEKKFLEDYSLKLEDKGNKIYYPARDTNQNDSIGLRICSDNRYAIKNSDEVHIYFNKKSNGSMFDVGMNFMAEKDLHVINPSELNDNYISNFISGYAKNINQSNDIFRELLIKREKIKELSKRKYYFSEINAKFLLDFGMSFMAEKPIHLLNRKDVKRTENKSFENVLLELDQRSW
jgi:hypothetical protein